MEERRFQNNAKCVAVIEIGRRLNVSQFFLIDIIVIFTRFLSHLATIRLLTSPKGR